jgi:hypothetical protein
MWWRGPVYARGRIHGWWHPHGWWPHRWGRGPRVVIR